MSVDEIVIKLDASVEAFFKSEDFQERCSSLREDFDVVTQEDCPLPPAKYGPRSIKFKSILSSAYGLCFDKADAEKLHLEDLSFVKLVNFFAPSRQNDQGKQTLKQQIQTIVQAATGLAQLPWDGKLGSLDSCLSFNADVNARLSDVAFQAQIDGILDEVELGDCYQRISKIETAICEQIVDVCTKYGLSSGWKGLVEAKALTLYMCLLYPNELASILSGNEDIAYDGIGTSRKKIANRFFLKNWLPLESSPEVFNHLSSLLGLDLEKVQFYEVFGLDEELLCMVPTPVVAVVACFPFTAAHSEQLKAQSQGHEDADKLFFVRQTIPNACGTVAVLNALSNIHPTPFLPNSFLENFVASTRQLTPFKRAAALEKDEFLAAVHEETAAMGTSDPTASQSFAKKADKHVATGDDGLHYTAMVEFQGKLWELDGLGNSPCVVCDATEQSILQASVQQLLKKIAQAPDDLRFSLMALSAVSTGQA